MFFLRGTHTTAISNFLDGVIIAFHLVSVIVLATLMREKTTTMTVQAFHVKQFSIVGSSPVRVSVPHTPTGISVSPSILNLVKCKDENENDQANEGTLNLPMSRNPIFCIWFLLLDYVDGQPYQGTSATKVSICSNADVDDFRKRVKAEHSNKLSAVDAADLLVYKNMAAFDAKDQLPETYSLSDLTKGHTKKDALLVVVQSLPQLIVKPNPINSIVGTFTTYADRKNPTLPYFPYFNRDEILTKMFDWLTGEKGMHQFLLLRSPAASGKTALLILFQQKYPHLNAIYISLNEDSNPWNSLLDRGLDIKRRACYHHQVIYMLDDSQSRYDYPEFWDVLINDIPLYFGYNVRFIISTNHIISTRQQPSPAVFRHLKTITQEDLLLSADQSLVLLNSEPPLGLPSRMKNFSQLKNTIIEHCNGLIGACCKSVLFYADQSLHDTQDEVKSLRLYYSKKLLNRMDFCFGIATHRCFSVVANDALLKCALGERIHTICNMKQPLSGILESFANAGMLTIDDQLYYVFTSLLAKRYFMKWFFPERAACDPSTLRELVMNAIESMSVTALMPSTSNPDGFPKEIAIQHCFMQGLILNTSTKTTVCSELSMSDTHKGIDFVVTVDGDRMWGITLVRCGKKISENISQFGAQEKYAGLQLNDYVVVHFCKGEKRMRHNHHHVTASFPIDAVGSFKQVLVKYKNEKAVILSLQP